MDQDLPHDFLVLGVARHPRLAGDGQSQKSAKGPAVVDHQLVVPEHYGFMGGHGLVDGMVGARVADVGYEQVPS